MTTSSMLFSVVLQLPTTHMHTETRGGLRERSFARYTACKDKEETRAKVETKESDGKNNTWRTREEKRGVRVSETNASREKRASIRFHEREVLLLLASN